MERQPAERAQISGELGTGHFIVRITNFNTREFINGCRPLRGLETFAPSILGLTPQALR